MTLTLKQRIERSVAQQLLRLPHPVQVFLSGKRPIVLDGERLHPEIQLLLTLRRLSGGGALHADDPDVVRRRMLTESRQFSDPQVSLDAIRELTIAGPGGPLRARHYVPKVSGPRPLLVFFHGGGFVVGDLDTHDEPCQLLCHHAGVHVLSVAYRLAPEQPFPAGVEDALAAFRWAKDHASTIGADSLRVGVGGDSAGGNLAAVVSQVTAAEGGPAPAFQLLVYPVTDRGVKRRSRVLFADGFFLTAADIDWFDDAYVGGREEYASDPRVAPIRAKSLAGLCPAIVVTAGFDPLRDEGDEYAEALDAAGVKVVWKRHPGFIHGFFNMSGVSPAARAAVVEIADELRKIAS